jgi:uncharacterized protein YraI
MALGNVGWLAPAAAAQTAPPANPATATTTDRLNMRTGPALSYSVVTVIPTGATVTLTGQESNGFRSVSWNGQSGWAFATYLSVDAPTPSPNETAETTDRVNLRSGPGTTFAVLTVVPNGGIVTLTGQSSNGFRSVTWGAYTGWISGTYLDLGGETPPPTTPPVETNAVTTDNLNLRTGPGVTFGVIAVMPRGSKVVLTGQLSNGYRSVSWNGHNGWAADDWLAPEGTTPVPEETTTTTDRLNLRTAPNTSSTVLTVIPSGATVSLTGQSSNGFRSVRYGGISGWAFEAYLVLDTTPPPVEPDAPFDVTNTIVGPARGSAAQALAFARSAGALRIDQVELFINEIYRLGPQIGFDPAILVAQSALETGYWKSPWWTLRLNPAGIGVTGDPAQNSSSPTFPSGTIAARAQMAHMHAEVFGSSQPLPAILQGVDPTYQRVFEAGWAGMQRTIHDLAGTWATDPLYDTKIVRVAREFFP